ncbi:folate-binding protein [Alcaligenaceae bacterium CGII-47]|nr:folate-binding protein [Alcaligenaceae bacterium CGII-47]
MTHCAALVLLDDLAVLAVSGEDAADFLHKQLSNDVLHITPTQARWAAYCTAQGRMLASMVVWRPSDNELRLLVSRDIAAAITRRLSMFVLRAKVHIELLDQLVHGCFLPTAPDSLPDTPAEPWSRSHNTDGEWITAPHSDSQAPRAWRISTSAQAAKPDNGRWRAADIQAGLPWIRQATQDMFIPQTLNMDLNNGIDFKKGCYPGQEIIARSHYRGTIKRRMAYGTVPWAADLALPHVADDLYAADSGDDRPVGRIIDLAHSDGILHALIERSLADPATTRYSLGCAQGPVLALHDLANDKQPAASA